MTDLVQITQNVDFGQAYWRRTVADRLREKFDKYALSKAGDGYRSHLGASLIGAPCTRMLWYHFRWFRSQIHSARMHSLFDQGHRIEAQMVETLVNLGAEFYYGNPQDKTEQSRFSALNGHFGGSVDGIFRWPEVGINEWVLLECKSSKTGSPFNELAVKEVMGAKPQHFAQQSTYGRAFGIHYAVYICYNKNDSQIYFEVVDLDWGLADEMLRRAELVITSQTPPAKINERPTYFVCKMCDFWNHCQGPDEPRPVANCRNCKNARPIENAQWYCDHWQNVIPKDFIPKGCGNHVFLPY